MTGPPTFHLSYFFQNPPVSSCLTKTSCRFSYAGIVSIFHQFIQAGKAFSQPY